MTPTMNAMWSFGQDIEMTMTIELTAVRAGGGGWGTAAH